MNARLDAAPEVRKSLIYPDQVPLCVDLDGTLIRSNLFLESVLLMLKRRPLLLFVLPMWLLLCALNRNIRSHAKAFIATQAMPLFRPEHLPYETELLAWLHLQKASGRSLWLCTGSDQKLAQKVADFVGIFEGVMGSDESKDFVGKYKAIGLVKAFGEKGFDYVGNSNADVPVWQRSRGIFFVNVSHALSRKWSLMGGKLPLLRFGKNGNGRRDVWRSLRSHQWVKNILVFVPLVTAQQWGNLNATAACLLAFISFCLCASSVYLCNDLLDLDADRQHPEKRHRPLASGDMPLLMGGLLSAVLLILAMSLATFVSNGFVVSLSIYWFITMAYSLHLKHEMVVDVITLAVLYTARIVAGALACTVHLSFWLVLFSVFFFTSLALAKRYTELDHMKRTQSVDASGRGYNIQDLPVLQSMGTACGMLAVLVLGLYINAPEVKALYSHPQAIWLLCLLLLYWIARVWLLTHRGLMRMDPVVFALEDKNSRLVALLGLLVMGVAL